MRPFHFISTGDLLVQGAAEKSCIHINQAWVATPGKKEILSIWRGSLSGHALQADDVSCLGSTVTLDDIELYLFVLIKGLIAFTLNCGEVDENVTTIFLLDKAEALLRVKPLDFTFHYDCASFRSSSCKSGGILQVLLSIL